MKIFILSVALIISATVFFIKPHQNYRYNYQDNFEDEQTGQLPGHWVQTYGQQSWKVKEKLGNHFLTQDNVMEDTSRIYLHLFERNPLFEGKFKLLDVAENGYFAFLLRYNGDGAWVRLEYNPQQQLFILIDQEDPGREAKKLSTVKYSLDHNWKHFYIKLDSNQLSFSIDGRKIMSSDKLIHSTFGRLGFETYQSLMQIDDIYYQGNQGRPNDGVVEGEIRIKLDTNHLNNQGRPYWGLHLGVMYQQDSDLLGVVGFRDPKARQHADSLYPFVIIHSNDNGLSWNNTAVSKRKWMQSVEGTLIRGIWPNFTKVGMEYIIMGYDTVKDKNTAFASSDQGKTWYQRGALEVDEELEQVHAGHPWQRFMMTMPAKLSYNSHGLFYPTTRVLWNSLDRGFSWKPIYVFHQDGSKTWNPRSQEHQVIELKHGKLGLYSRDDGARENKPESMTLVKRYSSDSGYSWSDYKINNTPFVSSKCAFSIKKDPYEKNTYWMFWTYNDKNDEPSVNNQPRTRLGLAVSYDYTKTWQYVMDVDDWGFPSNTDDEREAYLQKDNRYANLALWPSPDFLYLTARRRYQHGDEKLEDFCIFYSRIDKSRINIYQKFPGTRY